MRLMRLVLVVLTAGSALLVVDAARAQDDRKVYSAAGCRGIKASHDADLVLAGGQLKNNSKTANRKVECPIVRDNVSFNTANELDRVLVYVEYSSKSTGKFFCTVGARNLVSGALEDSQTVNDQTPGFRVLELGPLDITGTKRYISYYLRCTIPPKSRLLGYLAEEDEPTDGEPES